MMQAEGFLRTGARTSSAVGFGEDATDTRAHARGPSGWQRPECAPSVLASSGVPCGSRGLYRSRGLIS